ncbi:MAG TPA: FAD-dependent oxidoreductase [Terrimesophilobacter sp.]|uniref:NAD(P)/FAD-dependent oxidoreductase n=1 Tax=Terrimesophilobacter sp. TaxID=2906435 RepID=UPI002F95FD92
METTAFERSIPDARIVDDALADSVLRPFWLDDAPGASWPRFAGVENYDLVVVGGGFAGLWTALQAKQRDAGLRVALLEARTIGWAASGRNGGFCEATLTHGEKNGARRFPKELEQLDRLGMQNLDEIEQTVWELGLDCEFERTGSLAVAVEPYQVAELEEAREEANVVYLSGTEMRAEVASPTYLGGLWSMRDTAMVHPGKLAHELARACAEAGVDLFENSAVLNLDSDRTGPVTVQLATGDIRANRVALATNAFPSLLGRYRWHTIPVYDYVLMTEPLSAAQLASIGWTRRQGIADLANQFHYYRLTGDNRILFGGYDAIYHFGGRIRPEYDDRPASHRRLASHFLTTFPQLEGIRFTHRWAGVIDTCSRFSAFFGHARGGRVAYSAGFTGLGVAGTRFAANVMLDQLAGLTTERTSLKMVRSMPVPFPPDPAAWVGVEVSRWAMNRADHNRGKRNLVLRTLDAVGLGFDS